MKFSINKSELQNSVLSVEKALPVRATMPVLEGVLIEANDNQLHIVCSDLMYQKECTVDATVKEEGACVVKGKFFAEVLRKLPEGMVDFELKNNVLNIKCGRTKQKLQCIEYEDFPMFRAKGEQFKVTMKKSAFKNMVEHTAFAASQDDVRPVLTGVYVETNENGTVTMVATDSFQFAMTASEADGVKEHRGTIIPSRVLSDIAKMESPDSDTITLVLSQSHVTVEDGNQIVTARLLDGNYIDYNRIIPKGCKTRVRADKEILEEMVNRVSLTAREGSNAIQFDFKDDTISLHAESYLGRVDDEASAQIIGEPISITFNAKYISNVLKNIKDESVYIEMNTPVTPCAIKPTSGESYLYLVVPMRTM